jgi:hypothetical protein
LSAPQIYKKTEANVSATIFLWDGKSQQVKPLFDPSLNGLRRFTFPITNTQWTRVVGNVKRYEVEGLIDPSTIEPAIVEKKKNTLKQP